MERGDRGGQHPFDDELAQAGMLGWIVPSLHVMARNAIRLAPFALAFGLFAWLSPHIKLHPGLVGGQFGQFLDATVMLAVGTAIAAFGYAVLAHSEGAPWGLGRIAPLPAAAARLAALALFWSALGWLLGRFVDGVTDSPVLTRLLFELFRLLGIWALYLVIWLLSPLAVMYASVQVLTQVRAIRAEEPLPELVADSFRAVFGQAGRFLVPAWIIVGVLILLMHAVFKLWGGNLLLLALRVDPVAIAIVAATALMLTLPWWFVLERALRPELGLEDAASIAPLAPSAPGGTQRAVPVAALSAEDWASEIAAIEQADGPVLASRRLVDAVRARSLPADGFAIALAGLRNTAALPRELGGLAVDWLAAGRTGDLAWLVEQGLALDRDFLMDRPDQVLAIAKRLTQNEQPIPASRLLLQFLGRHQAHPDHVEAALQMARLLAYYRNNPDAARRLLTQQQAVHPDDPRIPALLRQLP
jgi:hypothetical protein